MLKKPINEYISFKENEYLEMKESKEFGKHIISKVDREAGEIILKVNEPNCFGIYDYLKSKYCYNCFKESKGKSKFEINCNQCKQVYFCSNECAELVMSNESFQDGTTTHIHTPLECLIFTTVSLDEELKPQSLHDQCENKMVINYFSKIAYVNVENNSISKENGIKFKNLEIQIDELVGDVNLDKHSFTIEALTDFKNRSTIVKNIFNRFNYDIKLEDIENVYIKSQKNVFGLWREDSEAYGIGMYCGGAPFLNHSCFPNVVRVQDNQSILMYSLVPIKKGDQIYNSYLDIKNQKSNRMDHLKLLYGFDCNCQRCSSPDDNNEFEKIVLKNSCKNNSNQCSGKLYLPINSKIRKCNFCNSNEIIEEEKQQHQDVKEEEEGKLEKQN